MSASFASVLRDARTARGFSPSDVAISVGCAPADVLAWESGDEPPPGVATLEVLEAHLGLPADLLLFSLRYPIAFTASNPHRVNPEHLKALCDESRTILDLVARDGLRIVESALGWPSHVNVWLDRPLATLPLDLPRAVTFSVVGTVRDWYSEFRCEEHDQVVAFNHHPPAVGT